MPYRSQSQQFVDLFHQVFLRFHQRSKPGDYRPSLEVFGVLEHLAATGPLTVTEAARHFERSQSAMSELIERIERRGIVERFPDERDRRRSLVWLTPEGVALWQRANRVLSLGLLEPAMDRLDDATVEALLTGLGALVGQEPEGQALGDPGTNP